MTVDMSKFDGDSTMEEVLARCQKAFRNYTGQQRLFTRDFSKEELAERRKQVAERIGKGAHLLLFGAYPQPSHLSSQDATFYYFTGLEVCYSYLLIDCDDGSSTLFLPPRDETDGEAGDKVGFEDADLVREKLGFADIKPKEKLAEELSKVKKLYLPFAELEGGGVTRFLANGYAGRREKEEWDGVEPRYKAIISKLAKQFPDLPVEDAGDQIGRTRRIKSEAEIEVLRQAGHLSALIMIESMKATHVGMCESQLEAIAKYIYSGFGNCDLGYGVIGACGERIVNGHYHLNNFTCEEDEVILMDCGPDMRHYSSDIARIWPVSGTYSDWHRQIYGFIVEYHKELLKQIKPGILAQDAYAEARAIMRKDYVEKWFPTGEMPEEIDGMLTQGGPYNHCVGLSVHDFVGKWRDEVIEEGMVFVVDPMAMFHEHQQYIRVEDTVVVTRDGCERLTGPAPIDPDETEELMKQPSSFSLVP